MKLVMTKTRIISLSTSAILLIIAVVLVKALPVKADSTSEIEDSKKGILVEVINPTIGTVNNTYSTTGKLKARDRFEIYAQVDGQIESSANFFREGNSYQKGDAMLSIDQGEYAMTLLAKKSDFITLITSILPDLKSDYPDSYPIWRTYVSSVDVKKKLPELPVSNNEQENFYLSGKGIKSNFYNIRSAEEKLDKYTIRAPFNGVVTAANIEVGTAVRMGTQLGTFISTSTYELEITIPIAIKHLVQLGTMADISSSDIPGAWKGEVIRIGGNIDEKSQSTKVFIRTSGSKLNEGMYLTAKLHQQPFEDAMTIPRKMLDSHNRVFVVEDDHLRLKSITVLSRQGDLAIIEGLPQNSAVLSTVVKSAYDGMPVRVATQNTSIDK
ncbi:efflux RND transporter periplasmic adaptor subunit [bacterium]|nr:efflux RND transporter periplasmic adaptor subunit [bacterium]